MTVTSILGGIGLFLFILFRKSYYVVSRELDLLLAGDFGSFLQGMVGTVFGLSAALLIGTTLYYEILSRKRSATETKFFQMIQFHRDNVANLSIRSYKRFGRGEDRRTLGKRAFVVFKMQLFELLDLVNKINDETGLGLNEDEQIDLAYMVFFYGLDDKWEEFYEFHLRNFPERAIKELELRRKTLLRDEGKNIGRTNQTDLSSYFRNMYNAFRLLDDDTVLSSKDKLRLGRIYRAQLSNSELAILFFNVKSRFGKKWNERELVEKYELTSNIPEGYVHKYNHKKSFDMDYEDDEIFPRASTALR